MIVNLKLASFILLATLSTNACANKTAQAVQTPTQVIFVVGDGMGPAYTTAYRYFADDPNTPDIERTVFDRLLVGTASTYPHHVTGLVTDSAASATSLATGVKTYNNAIGVDVDKKPLLTLIEWAKQQGMKTGVAVTSQVNHATPAGFSTHNESRHNYNEIADSYFDSKINQQFRLDVILGGGWKFFIREDRNLVDEFKQAGYQYVDQMSQLSSLKEGSPVLGLFADTGLPAALDSKEHQRLPALAKSAIKQLENSKGYFLLVEASQVDWAGHGNDIAMAMSEMHDMALTLEYLESYVDQHPNTLLVVTADHSTGGLTLGANDDYRWDPAPLRHLQVSVRTVAEKLLDKSIKVADIDTFFGITLTKEEQALLSNIEGRELKDYYAPLKSLFDKRSNTGWTTSGHTASDVQVFAKGQGAELFKGSLDNTDIAKKLFKVLGKE